MNTWFVLMTIMMVASSSSLKIMEFSDDLKHTNSSIEEKHSLLMEFIVDIISRNHQRNSIIITDKDSRRLIRMMSSIMLINTVVQLAPQLNLESKAFITRLRANANVIVWSNIFQELRIITQIVRNQLLGKRFSWLFIHDDPASSDIFFNHLDQYKEYFLLDSKFYALMPSNRQKMGSIKQIIPIKSAPSGESQPTTKLIYIRPDAGSKSEQRDYPLRGYHLKIGAVEYAPVLSITTDESQIMYYGYAVDTLNILSYYLGFSYEFVIENDGIFGSKENGTWNGVLGMLEKKEVDIGAAGFVLTPSRMVTVDYSAYLHRSSTVAVIRKSQDANFYRLDTYLLPFDAALWCMVAAMWLLISIFFALIFNLYGSFQVSVPHGATSFLRYHAYSIWLLLCVMLQMGLFAVSRSRVIQLLLVFFFAFALIVHKSYVSLLTAALTVKKPQVLYNDLDELLDDEKFGICALPFESTYQAMKEASAGTLNRVWKKINQDKRSIVKSLESGFNRVYNERYVFLAGARPAAHIMKSNCSFETLKTHYLKSTIHFTLQKNSPLTEIISLKIHTLRSSGILKKLDDLYLTDQAEILCPSNAFTSTITIQLAVGAFIVLGIGMTLSALSLFVEVIITKHT